VSRSQRSFGKLCRLEPPLTMPPVPGSLADFRRTPQAVPSLLFFTNGFCRDGFRFSLLGLNLEILPFLSSYRIFSVFPFHVATGPCTHVLLCLVLKKVNFLWLFLKQFFNDLRRIIEREFFLSRSRAPQSTLLLKEPQKRGLNRALPRGHPFTWG